MSFPLLRFFIPRKPPREQFAPMIAFGVAVFVTLYRVQSPVAGVAYDGTILHAERRINRPSVGMRDYGEYIALTRSVFAIDGMERQRHRTGERFTPCAVTRS